MKGKMTKWTQAVHAGKGIAWPKSRPAVQPIYQTTVFSFDSLEDVDQAFSGDEGTFVYSRFGNPSLQALEQALAQLEGGEAGLVASSGMSAITSAVLSLCGTGDHIITTQDLYGGTQVLFSREMNRLGIDVSFVDVTKPSAIEEAIKPNTKVLFVETISNPLMKVVDLGALAAIKRGYGLYLVVDNTFASPLVCLPLELGVDIVLESLTKYINGHSDVTGGVLVGSKEIIDRIRPLHINIGGVPSPFDCWLVMRGLKTLPLRMKQHCSNAMIVAEFLASQPGVTHVYYPGLPGHPQHNLASRQMSAFGGMLSFVVAGGCYAADKVIKRLKMIEFVPSLAGVATTISHPAKTSHRGMTSFDRAKLGIDDGLIRVSVGIEDPEDICADFEQALKG